jgi:transposase
MIPTPSGVRVWLAVRHTDMRRGMNSLALQVQQALGRDPHCGDLYVFRGRRADLVKIIWHDGIGMSLYAKRLERGRFIWPSPADGCLQISGSQLAYMLDGIDWRNPQRTFRACLTTIFLFCLGCRRGGRGGSWRFPSHPRRPSGSVPDCGSGGDSGWSVCQRSPRCASVVAAA